MEMAASAQVPIEPPAMPLRVLHVNQLAVVDAYYAGQARVRRDSLQIPARAFFQLDPALPISTGTAEAASDIVPTTDIETALPPPRKRRRKRRGESIEALIAAGKFVPLERDLCAALTTVLHDLATSPTRLAMLQPATAAESPITEAPTIDAAAPLEAPARFTHAADSIAIVRRAGQDEDPHEDPDQDHDQAQDDPRLCVLPPFSSFVTCDVRALDAASLGKFRLIVMDPPWTNKSVARRHGYATLDHTELRHLDIPRLAHDRQCVLGIWVTNRPLYAAYVRDVLLPQWGFDLHATWYWLKVSADGAPVTPLTSTHRLPVEKLLVAVRARTEPDRAALCKRLGTIPKLVVSIPLRHSWKPPPECFFDATIAAPHEGKLELFARELRPHWTSVGNEPLKWQAARLFSGLGRTAAPVGPEAASLTTSRLADEQR